MNSPNPECLRGVFQTRGVFGQAFPFFASPLLLSPSPLLPFLALALIWRGQSAKCLKKAETSTEVLATQAIGTHELATSSSKFDGVNMLINFLVFL